VKGITAISATLILPVRDREADAVDRDGAFENNIFAISGGTRTE